jgi:alpha-tubulin suppressor-like RCC1 family protein
MVIAWGNNELGQLGNNSTAATRLPVDVNTEEWTSALAGRFVTGLSVGSSALHSIVIYAAPQPEIQVEVMEPHITTLIDQVSAVDFGSAAAAERSFRVRNSGGLALMNVSANLTGADAASFTLVSTPAAAIAGNGTSVFSVVFTGTSPGLKSTTLIITSNDSDETAFRISLLGIRPANLMASFTAANDIPQTAYFIDLSGLVIDIALNFVPSPGTKLTVIKNTGIGPIRGRFSNLPNGAVVSLTYNGKPYSFIVWYYGGDGKNDLVLLWPPTGLASWGLNTGGQLGNKTTINRRVAVGVEQTGLLLGKTIVQLAHGGDHSLALCSDGTVAAWGRNTEGQLGDNGTTNRSAPVAVSMVAGISALAGKTVIGLAAGKSHSLAFCTDGTVAAWGYNEKGQLGDNSTTNRQVPVAVSTATGISALAGKTVVGVTAGNSHSLALCNDGTLVAWGDNIRGQMGDMSQINRLVPVAVNNQHSISALKGKSVKTITAGGDHNLALCSDGTLVGWGWDDYRQAGPRFDGSIGVLWPTEVNVEPGQSALAGKTVISIAAGAYHSLALCDDGTVVSWGNGTYGQLGDNSLTFRSVPVAVNVAAGTSALAGKTVVAITAGRLHSLVLCSDGTLASWGSNDYGQLGDNGYTQQNVPVAVNSAAGSSVLSGLPGSSLSAGACGHHGLVTLGQPAESFIAVKTNGAAIAMEGKVDIGDVEVLSKFVSRTFTITNSGNSPLNLTGSPLVNLSGTDAKDFSINWKSTNSVPAHGSISFTVVFDPSVTGSRTAILAIQSDALNYPSFNFKIQGFGAHTKRRSQTITFAPPSVYHLAQNPVNFHAFASSGLPVKLKLLNSEKVTWENAEEVTWENISRVYGSFTVQATQAGDGIYAPAPAVNRTIRLNAYPSLLTLFNLSQTYTGTPREINATGGTGTVTLEYKIGTNFGSSAPTNAGSYSVRATDSRGTKTGTLVITKAPLYVTPEDKNKLIGEDNPPLTLRYSGLVNGEPPSMVTTAPVLKTTALKTSIGGVYTITASGGVVSANYTFIYQQGSLVVDSFASSYEALLTGGSNELVGKLATTVSAGNTSFTGSLSCIHERAALPLKGTLVTNPATRLVTGSATVTSSGITYIVTITVGIDGSLIASVTRAGSAYASLSRGRRLLALAAGKTVPYSGAHTAVLEPATPAGSQVPRGAGWATAAISTKGVMTFTGRLGDGTAFTSSVNPDDGVDPAYRLFVQPYKTGSATRALSCFGGSFALLPHPSLSSQLSSRRYVEASTLSWFKAALLADAIYSSGFGPVSTVLMLDPWLPPAAAKGTTPSITLAGRLGLTDSSFKVLHSDTGSTLNGSLPYNVSIFTTNVVTPTTISERGTNWKATLVPNTGTFTGSFELSDVLPKPRIVTFSGVLRQPATASDTLIGDGHYLLPPLTGSEKSTGEVMFLRP